MSVMRPPRAFTQQEWGGLELEFLTALQMMMLGLIFLLENPRSKFPSDTFGVLTGLKPNQSEELCGLLEDSRPLW